MGRGFTVIVTIFLEWRYIGKSVDLPISENQNKLAISVIRIRHRKFGWFSDIGKSN